MKNPIKPRKKRDLEGPIHKAILHFLLWKLPKSAKVHHSPNELDMAGRDAARQVAKARDMGTVGGWPDLEIIYSGRIYFIEVKSEKGPLTGNQPQCHEDLGGAGAPVGIARSVNDAEALLIKWGLLTPTGQKLRGAG